MGFILESKARRHGAEGFFLGDQHVVAGLGQNGRLKEGPAEGVTTTAAQHLGALLDGITDMGLDFGQRLHIDQRALLGVTLQGITDAHGRDGFGQLGGEGVVHAVLNKEAVNTDAGLPGVTEFGSHGAFDGCVQIGIVKHDKRRVAAEFQRDFFQRVCRLAHQQFAGAGGAGERQFAHNAGRLQRPADGHGVP